MFVVRVANIIKMFAAICRVRIAETAQYRTAQLSNSAVGIFWGIIEVTVYRVFYLYANNVPAINSAAMTLTQTVSYIWLMQMLLSLTPHNVEAEFAEKINNGDVGVELCRPIDMYSHWFFKVTAGKLVPLFWRSAPLLAVALLMPEGWRLGPPSSLSGLALMLASCAFSLFLCSAYAMLVTVIRMDVTWGDGPMYIILTFGMLFSGAFLPLMLWPDALQKILLLQPFAGYMDIPIRFYIGAMKLKDAPSAFALQLLWTVAFVIAGRLLMRTRLRKTIVQGG